jgi:hypothetical protein
VVGLLATIGLGAAGGLLLSRACPARVGFPDVEAELDPVGLYLGTTTSPSRSCSAASWRGRTSCARRWRAADRTKLSSDAARDIEDLEQAGVTRDQRRVASWGRVGRGLVLTSLAT